MSEETLQHLSVLSVVEFDVKTDRTNRTLFPILILIDRSDELRHLGSVSTQRVTLSRLDVVQSSYLVRLLLFSVPDLTFHVLVFICMLTVLTRTSIDFFSFLDYVDVDLGEFVLSLFDRFSIGCSFSFDISRKFRFFGGNFAFNICERCAATTEIVVDLSFGVLVIDERESSIFGTRVRERQIKEKNVPSNGGAWLYSDRSSA